MWDHAGRLPIPRLKCHLLQHHMLINTLSHCRTHLGHLGFVVASQEGQVVDFILHHKVLLLSFEILQENAEEKQKKKKKSRFFISWKPCKRRKPDGGTFIHTDLLSEAASETSAKIVLASSLHATTVPPCFSHNCNCPGELKEVADTTRWKTGGERNLRVTCTRG